MQRGAECPPGPTSGHRWKQRLAVRGSLGGRSNIKFVSTWSPLLMASLCQNHTKQKIILGRWRRFCYPPPKDLPFSFSSTQKRKGSFSSKPIPPSTSHPKYLDLWGEKWMSVTSHKNNQLQVEDILKNPFFINMVQVQTIVLVVVPESLASWGREPLCSCNTSNHHDHHDHPHPHLAPHLVVLMVMQGPVSSSTKPCHSPPLCPRALPNNFIALPPTQIQKYKYTNTQIRDNKYKKPSATNFIL